MSSVTLIGGPEHGRRMEIERDVSVVRVPMAPRRPTIHDTQRLTHEIAEYRRAWGDEYRWEGMIEDANLTLSVSEEALAEGGPKVRQAIRDEVRRTFRQTEPMAELDHRAIWRFRREPGMLWRITARMGPGRVPYGLRDRARRHAGVVGSSPSR